MTLLLRRVSVGYCLVKIKFYKKHQVISELKFHWECGFEYVRFFLNQCFTKLDPTIVTEIKAMQYTLIFASFVGIDPCDWQHTELIWFLSLNLDRYFMQNFRAL